MSEYKLVKVKQHPYREKLKKLKDIGKNKDARTQLEAEIDKKNPDYKAELIAEVMQKLGMI